MQDPDSRHFEGYRKARRALWAIILLAVAARAASALYQGNEVTELPGVADQISYHELALRVVEGHGFSFGTGWWPATAAGEPTAHWSYLYVLFLAAVYSLLGPNPIAARLIQAVLAGLLQPWLTWRIARRLFGPRIGLVSAALSSFYAYFVFYGGALMTEAFFIVAILWILDIATGMTDGSDRDSRALGWTRWAQLGVACAVAVLFRQVILLLVPVVLAWIAWRLSRRAPGMPQLLGRVSLALGIILLSIAPWTLRNYKAFHAMVLLNTNAGFAFFWGNHPIHGTEFIPILPASVYGALIPSELRGLNEAEMDRALLRRGLSFVREDPARYLLLSLSRAREYFRFWPSAHSSRLSNYARALSFGLLLPFLLSGLFLAFLPRSIGKGSNFQRGRSGKSLLLLVAGLYTLLHLLTWSLVRYRLPVDAILIPFASLAAVFGYDRIRETARTLGCALGRSYD